MMSLRRVGKTALIHHLFHELSTRKKWLFLYADVTFRELLTSPQWSLLQAIAKEGNVYTPTANAFIRTYDLGTPATVKRYLASLLKKEMIFRQFDREGNGFYQVYDVFLSPWLEHKQ